MRSNTIRFFEVFIIFVGVLLLSGLTEITSFSAPNPPAQNGRIAFTSNRNGNLDIYTINANGTNEQRVTTDADDDYDPSFSPDGTRIAFNSRRNGNIDIYVINTDGTNEQRVTANVAGNIAPSFSPDGTRIAFSSIRNDNEDIYIINTDGTNERRVTNTPDPDSLPAFSPDGLRIAFISHRFRPADIFTINIDGTDERRVTFTDNDNDFSPSFSPDGTRIAFSSRRSNGFLDIYVINTDGTNERGVTTNNNSASDGSPSFSPDGTRIAYASTSVIGNTDIYTVNADGTNEQRVTINAASDNSPSWGVGTGTPMPTPTPTPEPTPTPTPQGPGGKIAFSSNRNGNFDIYVMNADGTDVRQLTTNTSFDLFPSISADGSKIAFYSTRSGDGDIYLVNADGTNEQRITTDADNETSPALSPDGTTVAYIKRSDSRNPWDIYLSNVDGTNVRFLTFSGSQPSFSADGNKIAYVREEYWKRNEPPLSNIDVINVDGTGNQHVTAGAGDDYDPAFSPDGNKIAFGRKGKIYSVNLDGTSLRQVTSQTASEYQPSYSPDGNKIAFVKSSQSPQSGTNIYTINTDGTDEQQLTNTTTNNEHPSWSRVNVPPTPTNEVVLNEIIITAPGTDVSTGCEYVEFRGTPNALIGNFTFVDVEGDVDQNVGLLNYIRSLQGVQVGSNGLIVITDGSPCRTFAPGTTVITDVTFRVLQTPTPANPNQTFSKATRNNGTNSFLIMSGQTTLRQTQDADANNDGVLDFGSVYDGIAVRDTNNATDVTFGLLTLPRPAGMPAGEAVNAATRLCNDATRNSITSWYFGDLDAVPATLNYNPKPNTRSANFPSGGQLTPGGDNAPIAQCSLSAPVGQIVFASNRFA